jgi:hypothetical protein
MRPGMGGNLENYIRQKCQACSKGLYCLNPDDPDYQTAKDAYIQTLYQVSGKTY